MRQVETWCFRALGLLLLLLGVTLFLSPQIAYSTHQQIRNTPYRVRREKAFLVPRPIAAGIAGAGILVFILAGRTRKGP